MDATSNFVMIPALFVSFFILCGVAIMAVKLFSTIRSYYSSGDEKKWSDIRGKKDEL